MSWPNVFPTWTDPVRRYIQCPHCKWRAHLPRKNGAWVKLSTMLREHLKKEHPTP